MFDDVLLTKLGKLTPELGSTVGANNTGPTQGVKPTRENFDD